MDEEKKMWEVKGTMIGAGRALVENTDEGWEVLEGVGREGDFWTNGMVKIRCGKKELEESGWKVWEDETMVDKFDGKVVKKEELGGEEEEGEEMEIDEVEENGRGRGDGKGVEKVEKGKAMQVEVVEISSGSEGGSGMSLIEEWKEGKRAKERRLRDENRKRRLKGW